MSHVVIVASIFITMLLPFGAHLETSAQSYQKYYRPQERKGRNSNTSMDSFSGVFKVQRGKRDP